MTKYNANLNLINNPKYGLKLDLEEVGKELGGI